ncbi:MAG: CorA family divalent cation transporter, partial [Alphaproteobacteria bacterium]|nr:CorA family divalent cation transporter [Alphaproteobacteria bacterium]
MSTAEEMTATEDTSGLLHGLVLDGQGGARALSFADLESGVPPNSWVHLDHHSPEVRAWLVEKSGLDPLVCEALLAEETRPRCTPFGEGLVLILRGVNLNPGADPEDMVSLRLW